MGSACTWGSMQGCSGCWLCLPPPAAILAVLLGQHYAPPASALPAPISSNAAPGCVLVLLRSADLTRGLLLLGLCHWLPAACVCTADPSPDASKAVSAKIRAAPCGSPKADGGASIAVGLHAPHCSSATGRAACSLEGPGSCLSPHPGLCCLSDTQHTGSLNEIKPSVPLCNRLTGSLGTEREEDEELNFLSVLSCPW